MPVEPQEVSAIANEKLGSFCDCLVDGDREQRRGRSRLRRRALAISVIFESAVLTMLVLVPLFGKIERITIKDFVPIQPYGHASHHPQGNPKPGPAPAPDRGIAYFLARPRSRPNPSSTRTESPNDPPEFDPTGNEPGTGTACNWCVQAGDGASGPRAPLPATEIHHRPQVIRMTQLDPGMLIHRVEPVYPSLALQIHREGRVELRAIIGTDGTIQFLQVVAGDPLFEISAREAVQQWRYRPAMLNGQPVEIDTYITVIYTMQH
jgi:periplasmic protein TonB